MHTPREQLAEIVDNLTEIVRLLSAAVEIQWDKSPAPPAARDDTSERPSGGAVPNPTADTVFDGARLQVRAEVRRAEAFLSWCVKATRTIRNGIDRALTAWEGR